VAASADVRGRLPRTGRLPHAEPVIGVVGDARGRGAVGLLGRLARLQDEVTAAVQRRRLDDPSPDDPFRGLYLSDDVVDRLLGTVVPSGVDDSRLSALAADFGLSEVDVELLLVALAPEVDARFERFYGYLNDDVSRRRASVGLALELCGASPADFAARARLTPGAPLVERGLVVVEDPERPFLTRALRVPDRVVAHLLGDDRPDALVRDLLAVGVPGPAGDASALAAALGGGVRLAYVEPAGACGLGLAVAAVVACGRVPLVLDLARLAVVSDVEFVVAALAREVRLRRAGVIAGPVDALGDVRVLLGLPGPVVLVGRLAEGVGLGAGLVGAAAPGRQA
jgi:hypothetical protein